MYSYQGNTPKPLPSRIRLSDGSTRTDPASFTDAEIADAGYVYVEPFSQSHEDRTQKVIWDSNTTSWQLQEKTTEEVEAYDAIVWQGIRRERDELLQSSDVDVLRQLEESGTVTQEMKDYRQALRDLPQTQDLYSVTWPTKP